MKNWQEYNEEDFLLISGIQHFFFCRRQWALINIENCWAENIHTIEGNIMHEKAHGELFRESRKDTIITRGMNVFSRRLGISGQCDIVEFKRNPEGISLAEQSGKWQVYPIEYKKGHSKTNDSDKAQLCAQALCLEEMLCCEIGKGAIFYGETRQREEIIFSQELKHKVEAAIEEMHALFKRGHTPKVKPSKACPACSLRHICEPKLLKGKSVSAYIAKHIEE